MWQAGVMCVVNVRSSRQRRISVTVTETIKFIVRLLAAENWLNINTMCRMHRFTAVSLTSAVQRS